MVKCFCIQIFDKNTAQMLAAEYDLATFSFFQRGSVQEAMNFMAKTTIERTSPGVRTKVEEAGFLGNVYVRPDGLGIPKTILMNIMQAGVIATDQEYPARVAFSVRSSRILTSS
jgi:synaptobrevin family protein YKT6